MNEPRRSSTFADLGQFLDGCASLDRECRDATSPGLDRQFTPPADCHGVLQSRSRAAVSQRLLIGSGQHGTALALIAIRAAWVRFGAKDDWLEAFTEPVPDGSLKEPVLGPPIPSMLYTIEPNAPDMGQSH